MIEVEKYKLLLGLILMGIEKMIFYYGNCHDGITVEIIIVVEFLLLRNCYDRIIVEVVIVVIVMKDLGMDLELL